MKITQPQAINLQKMKSYPKENKRNHEKKYKSPLVQKKNEKNRIKKILKLSNSI